MATAPSPAASGTSLTVAAGQGTRFPAVPFNATVWAVGEIPIPSNAEIVRVTNVTGDVLTFTRAQEGTSARSIVIGDQIAATITVRTLTDIETAFAGTNGAITGGSITVNSSGVSVNLPAYLTTAALSQDSSKYAGTNGVITGGSITVNTAGVSVNLPAYLSSQSNQAASAANGSFAFQTVSFSNVNGVSFGTSAGSAITASIATSLTNVNVSAGTTSNNLSALVFSNSNALSFGLNGSTITGSYTVPTVTAGSDTLWISNLGNTSGTSGVISGDQVRLVLAGGNNITLSQSINGSSATITISGANAGGAQTGISGIIVSDATYTSGTVSFSNAGNITIASSVNGATQFIKLSGNAAQTTQSAIKGFGVSNTGQTAGNTGLSTGIDWVLAGSQSITLSQSTAGGGPNTVWLQHPAWLTTAMQSNAVTLSNINVSAGTTSNNLSAITFSNANGVSFGLNGSTLTGSVAAAGGAQTGISGIIVSDATYTSGTVSFSNAGNITISSSVNGATQYIKLSGNAAQTTQSAIKGFGVSNTGQTAGNTGISSGIDWVLAGSNSITLSQSTAGGGPNTVWIQHPAWLTTAGLSGDTTKYVQNWKLTGNTAGTTSSAQGTDLWLSGGNSITVSGNSNTIVFSVGAYLTTADLSANSSNYVRNWKLTGNTAGTTSSAQGTDFWLSGGANVTVSGNSNTVVISAAAQTNQSAIKAFGASNTGNTAGNTGVSTGIDWVIAGTNGVTVSESTAGGGPNTLWLSGGGGGGGLGSIGISTQGNTSGTTGFASASYQFVGTGGITLNQSTSNNGVYTLSISAPASSSLTASSPLSLSSNGSTITMLINPVVQWDPYPVAGAPMLTNSTLGQSSLFFYPFDLPVQLSASRVNFFISVATTSSNAASSGSGSIRLGYGLYTRGTGTGTDRLTLLTSYSAAIISYTSSSSSQLGATIIAGLSNATSHSTANSAMSTSNASTYMANSVGGFRVVPLPLGMTLTPGRYWMGVSQQTTNNASASFKVDISVLQQTQSNQIAYRPFGTSSAASNASVFGVFDGNGTYSAQSAGWPNSIALSVSDIKMPPSMTYPYFNFSGVSVGTALL